MVEALVPQFLVTGYFHHHAHRLEQSQTTQYAGILQTHTHLGLEGFGHTKEGTEILRRSIVRRHLPPLRETITGNGSAAAKDVYHRLV